MSRSGYVDDCDQWDLIRWRGAVNSAIRGKRGQAFLQEMLAALDAMPEKSLIENDLQTETGEVCAMGAVGLKRGIDMSKVDPEDREQVAEAFGISQAMAAEIAYENDESWGETPEKRWTRMRKWVVAHIKDDQAVAIIGETSDGSTKE
jgi:hypothetical protein